MNRIALILILITAGCVPVGDNPDSGSTVDVEPVPREIAPPQIDEMFSNPETLAQWNEDLTVLLDNSGTENDPREMFEAISATHTISMSNLEPLFGSADIWNADHVVTYGESDDVYIEPEPESLERAGYLERQDQKWPAAQIFIAHGNNEGANRCAKKLFDEGSYKVAAMTAVMTGDMEMMTAATTKMVEARHITKTFDIIRYALDEEKVQAARHIADTHGFDLTEVSNSWTARRFALAGDPSLLPPFIEGSITQWEEKSDIDSQGSDVVADIVLLARTDPAKAREFAGRYLKLPHANVVVWVSCGEGCYASPIQGTIELYELIKNDDQLRNAYLDRMRAFVSEAFPPIQVDGQEQPWTPTTTYGLAEYDEWSHDQEQGNLLFSLLMNVRATGDTHLIALWTELLGSFRERQGGYNNETLAFEFEIGRGILGQSVNANAPDLSLAQQYLLARLTGQAVPDLTPLWEEMESGQYRGEYYGAPADVIWLNELISKGSASQEYQAALLVKYERQVSEGATYAALLHWEFKRAVSAKYGYSHGLRGLLNAPWGALRTNMNAQSKRADYGLPAIDLYPVTVEQVEEILAPHLTRMQTELPVQLKHYQVGHPPRP